jgi:DNA-binding beta-propeller fold protein YncE
MTMRFSFLTLLCITLSAQAASMSASAGEVTFSPAFAFGSTGDEPGQFRYVEDMALSPDGRLFATDASHAWVQVFDQQTGKFLKRFGGKVDGEAGLVKPEGIALAPNGDVYVADYDTGFIKRYDAALEWKQTFSEYGSAPGQNIHAEFMSIYDGRLYMAEAGNHRVDVFDLAGKFLFDFGGRGTEPGQFNNPEAAKVNSVGEVFVADLKNNRVQVFDKDGKFLRMWGASGSAHGQFAAPACIGFDAFDNVYVTEIGNSRVQVFRPDGSFISAFGEAGDALGQLRNVHGIAVNPKTGRVFVADSDNHRIQVFAPNDPAKLQPHARTD